MLNAEVLPWRDKNFIKDHFFEKSFTAEASLRYYTYDSTARKAFKRLMDIGYIVPVGSFTFRVCREKIYYEDLE